MSKRKPKASVAGPSIKSPAGSMTARDLDPDGNFDSNEGQTQYEPVSPADVAPGRAEAAPAPLGALEPGANVHEPIPCADGGLLLTFDSLWTDRLKKLAKHAGLKPGAYIERLLRREWAAGGAVASKAAD